MNSNARWTIATLEPFSSFLRMSSIDCVEATIRGGKASYIVGPEVFVGAPRMSAALVTPIHTMKMTNGINPMNASASISVYGAKKLTKLATAAR